MTYLVTKTYRELKMLSSHNIGYTVKIVWKAY